MWAYINILLQTILPQHGLSRCMYRLVRWRWAPWKNFITRVFIRHYQVDMQIAEQSDPDSYASFNAFFGRRLKNSERPIDDSSGSIVSPVDASVSQIGNIDDGVLLQAKGKHFSLGALLANDEKAVDRFNNGSFATLYLSPQDYHRIHLPVKGELRKMIYIPGDLFSVNEATSKAVDHLFARNERVICLFDTEFGLMATILVGAIFVGSMETVWQGEITPTAPRKLRIWNYTSNSDTRTSFAKGDEIGRFNMGSTVILLFEPHRVHWSATLHAGSKVEMGQLIASGAT